MKNTSAGNGMNWKITLGLLFGLFLAAMATSLVLAQRRLSRVVDSDYYSHGLHYGERNGTAGDAAPWTMTPAVAGGDLQVRMKDEAGAPVTGGELAFQPEGAVPAVTIALRETAPGVYCAPRPQAGDVRGSLRFTKGAAVLVCKVALLK